MSINLKETDGFKPTYKVYDKTKAKHVGIFYTLYDAISFVQDNTEVITFRVPLHSYTMKLEPAIQVKDGNGFWDSKVYNRTYTYTSYDPPRFVILTTLGDIVPEAEVVEETKRNRHRKHYKWSHIDYTEWCNRRNSRLIYKKGSTNKIKLAFRKKLTRLSGFYNNDIRGYYRHPKTHSEMKIAAAHVNEYGESIVRGKRRVCNLPDSWDDLQNGSYRSELSWKHHSKRRKQWIPK